AADGEAQFSPELDPEVEVEIEETLSNVDPDADGDGEVSDIEAQLAERTEDLQRLNAEYTNYRRRTERDRQAVIEAAKSQVLAALLPILDDLELARQHGDLKDSPLKAIADKLTSTLEGQQLEAFGAEGDAFDPEIHEAVQDLSSGGEQVVGTVLRRGYRVGDKLVRNAMVIIADPESSESES
ncbi:MAG: nucleotide exchange factor GrpE, partial [Corynebacterium casei]